MAKDIACFLFSVAGQTFVDAVTGSLHGTVAGQVSKLSEEGRVLGFAGATATTSRRALNNPGGIKTTRTSLIARVRLTALPSTQTDAITYYNAASGATNTGVYVAFTNTGTAGGGAWGNTPLATFGTTVRTNQWVTLGACHTSVAAQGKAYENGVPLGTANIVADTVGTADTIRIGREPANYDALFVGDIAWIVAFNRVLTDAEFLWWYQNPFGVLERRRGWILAAAAPVVVTGWGPLLNDQRNYLVA